MSEERQDMNSNWYKEAKLSDGSSDPSRFMAPTVCSGCHKWRTENESGKDEWKYYYEMNPDEQSEVDRAKDMFQAGNAQHQSSVCPTCYEQRRKRTL